MILGYLLIGVTVGFFGAAAAFTAGAPIWALLGVYTLSGSASVVVMAVAHVVAGRFTARSGAQTTTDLQGAIDAGEPSVARPVTPLPQRASEARFTILAVDDDPFILDLVDTIAETAGDITVVTVPSAPEALTLLADPAKTFDYLLFDISMPQMSGIELCHRVRLLPAYQDVPIVMLTARRDMDHIAEALRAGATDYATKPFDVTALGQRFETARDVFKANVRAAASPEIPGLAAQGMTTSRTDYLTLSNYIGLLPEKDAATLQIFAVRIDRMDVLSARYAPVHLDRLLDSIAAATAASLQPQGTMMAFNADNDLLVVTPTRSPIDLLRIEALVTQCVRDSDPDAQRHNPQDDDVWCGASIGTPVPLSGPKADRASRASTLALEAAEARILSKYARTMPRLTQASGA